MPCTVVNAIMALAAGAVVAVFWPLAGIALVILSAVVILFRGYLVPGTPTLTKRFLPVWVLAWFGKAPDPDTAGPLTVDEASDARPREEANPESMLARAGLLVECPDEDDVCLEESFRTDWNRTMHRLRRDDDAVLDRVAELVGEEPTELTLDPERGDGLGADPTSPVRARPVDRPATVLGLWESYGALLADTGAATVLDHRLPDWIELQRTDRNGVLAALRIFVEECPGCGGPVALGEELRESCCWSGTVVQVACEDCGATYFEADESTLLEEATA